MFELGKKSLTDYCPFDCPRKKQKFSSARKGSSRLLKNTVHYFIIQKRKEVNSSKK
jgi:hypothetical protein